MRFTDMAAAEVQEEVFMLWRGHWRVRALLFPAEVMPGMFWIRGMAQTAAAGPGEGLRFITRVQRLMGPLKAGEP